MSNLTASGRLALTLMLMIMRLVMNDDRVNCDVIIIVGSLTVSDGLKSTIK